MSVVEKEKIEDSRGFGMWVGSKLQNYIGWPGKPEKQTVGLLGHSACCVACTCSDELVWSRSCNSQSSSARAPPVHNLPPTPHLPLLGSAKSIQPLFFREVIPAPSYLQVCVCVSLHSEHIMPRSPDAASKFFSTQQSKWPIPIDGGW